MNQANIIQHENKIRHDFMTQILSEAAGMEDEQRSLDEIVRLLAVAMQCSLVLEESLSGRVVACWPENADQYCKEKTLRNVNSAKTHTALIRDITIAAEKTYHLSLRVQAETLPLESDIEQVLEVIRLYILIWDRTCIEDDENAMIKAIIRNNQLRIQKINQKLRFNFTRPTDVWVLRAQNAMSCFKNDTERQSKTLRSAKDFFRSRSRKVLAGVHDNSVVILMDSVPYAELDEGLSFQLLDDMQEDFCLYLFRGASSPNDIGDAYAMLKKYEKTLCRIYHKKKVFASHDLHFAGICEAVLESGQENVSRLRNLFSCLRDGEEEALLHTLATYYLDAEGNSQKTGALLFMHNNTVKYRLHKIRQKLGIDITRMPANYNIYLALAVERILKAWNE